MLSCDKILWPNFNFCLFREKQSDRTYCYGPVPLHGCGWQAECLLNNKQLIHSPLSVRTLPPLSAILGTKHRREESIQTGRLHCLPRTAADRPSFHTLERRAPTSQLKHHTPALVGSVQYKSPLDELHGLAEMDTIQMSDKVTAALEFTFLIIIRNMHLFLITIPPI